MIKFFRKVRQKLLQENRFSKYLLYATGEIFLVVIGILIALQINTWNEHRKDKLLEQNYLKNIERELNSQRNLFQQQIDWETDKIQKIASIISSYNANNGFTDDRTELDQLKNLFGIRFPRILNSTYLEMQSSGNLKLIADKNLLHEITQFYQDLVVFQTMTQNNHIEVRNYMIAPLMRNVTFPSANYFNLAEIAGEHGIDDIADDQRYVTSFKLLSDPKIALEMTNGISYRKAVSLDLIQRTREKISETEVLIEKIRQKRSSYGL